MPFDHNDHYHQLLLRQVPPGCARALDCGCGTGRFAWRLARTGVRVDAVDASAEAIAAARAGGTPAAGVPAPHFRRADLTETALPPDRYDFVSCLASLHHMPLGTLGALRRTLAPGGVLVVLGCYAERTPTDLAWSLAAAPVNAVARLTVAAREAVRRAGPAPAARAPVHPPETSLAEVRAAAAASLPGCRIRRLLFWRYLLVYRDGRTANPVERG
ncbi:class I SAM-dependent methyltransferase [Streptomyces sp. AJS327]|uniref:class I SAM-dependent methyltransferase n=1 Tax=Streptomyces sp. AJS327 TaxID=2545265 RepID=UPI0015DFB3D4|nr:class I SAM-dependent methyltransferase [Streptomyces sp. AJS327]MBA0052359.1 class I SAM-dependent methyltransferase [Streptomyces sp. AJS327]